MVGYAQEAHAGRIVEGLKKTLALRALVVRNGVLKDICAEDVVIGDVLYLKDVS